MKFDTSFTVAASPQACFDYVTDPDKGTQWASAAKEVRAEGEPGVGRKIIAKAELIIPFEITQTVTVYEPPSKYSFSASKPVKMAYDFSFDADGDGTKVTCNLDADPGKFLPGGSFVLKPKFKKTFKDDMTSLEKHLNAL